VPIAGNNAGWQQSLTRHDNRAAAYGKPKFLLALAFNLAHTVLRYQQQTQEQNKGGGKHYRQTADSCMKIRLVNTDSCSSTADNCPILHQVT